MPGCEVAPPPAMQTEMKPSEIMMLSEAEPEGGDEVSIPPMQPSAAGSPTGGAPCPKCGRALKRTGRHFHIRKCGI